MGNLGFQELLLIFIVIGAIDWAIVAASRAGNKTVQPSNNTGSHSPPTPVTQTVIISGESKTVGLALLLAFLFGPLGLLLKTIELH